MTEQNLTPEEADDAEGHALVHDIEDDAEDDTEGHGMHAH
jgi:hypothetical protein